MPDFDPNANNTPNPDPVTPPTPPPADPTPLPEPSDSQQPTQLPSTPRSGKKLAAIIAAVVVIILAVVLILVMIQPKSTTTPSGTDQTSQQAELLETEAYESMEHGISIKYPTGWQVAAEPDQGNYITIVKPDHDTVGDHHYQARINVSYEATTSTLDAYVQSALDVLPTVLTDFALVSNESAIVDGAPAKTLEYTAKDENGTPITVQQVIFMKDGKGYSVTGLSATDKWDAYRDAIDASIMSMMLL